MKQYNSVFTIFSQKEGCQHIATRFALKGIEEIIISKNVKSVFEFGIGIGTIPYLIGKLNRDVLYFGTENNDFCLNAIQENLPLQELSIDFNLLNSYEQFNQDVKFDLIIIDGKFDNTAFIKKIVHQNTIIFIEGDRIDQQKFIQSVFPNSLKSRRVSLEKNKIGSPFYDENKVSYEGGYTIFRLNSNYLNKFQWFKDKIQTYLNYKLRK